MTRARSLPPRRVLATRDAAWARTFARWLGRVGVRPDAVSIAGVVFAIGAAVAFSLVPDLPRSGGAALLLAAAAGIQLRLLCNLLDGMLAVEEGFGSRVGDIYNDLPDRVADVCILVGAGCSVRDLAHGVTLGWAAAAAALATAYVRLLGASLGTAQHFIGPMAKQHRMFALTVAALLAAGEALLGMPPRAIRLGLGVIVAGSLLTVFRRTRRIAREVDAR